MSKFQAILPLGVVFISNFCIMVLELIAGRMIAPFLGSSIYTWTSVIGVVLAGIAAGGYGLADQPEMGKVDKVPGSRGRERGHYLQGYH